jgi:phosphoribosylglycinamide formyltransferase-1
VKARIAVLISGRGSNLERILWEAETGVLAGACSVVVVIANRAEAPGLAIAEEHGVPTCVVPSAKRATDAYGQDLLAALEPWRVDYVVLAGFFRVISAGMVARYRDRIVNIHPADTAQYQGAHGYEWALAAGLSETAVTVHLVDEGLDTGRVLAQRSVSLAGAATLEDVVARGLRVEHELYSEILARLIAGEFGAKPRSR